MIVNYREYIREESKVILFGACAAALGVFASVCVSGFLWLGWKIYSLRRTEEAMAAPPVRGDLATSEHLERDASARHGEEGFDPVRIAVENYE